MARTIRVTQTTYLKKVLARFEMTSYILVLISMVVESQLQAEVINKVTSQSIYKY